MRVNGWQRIGIVASVVWFFVGGFLGNNQVIKPAEEIFAQESDICFSDSLQYGAPDSPLWYKRCKEQVEKNYLENVKGHWGNALIAGLSPIPFGWLFIWGLIALFRWVRAGFKQDQISN